MSKEKFMKEAIRLAEKGMSEGKGGPFGAVVVKDGKIIGSGCNCVTSTNDPTAHAEVIAIREACKNLETFDLKGAEIYTSCEPCPMCLSAIYWANIDAVYYANTRKDAENIGFRDNFIYEEINTPLEYRKKPIRQMLRDEAQKTFKAWELFSEKIEY